MEDPPTYVNVKLELLENGRIALLKYNRPRSGNSLHPVLLQEMVSAVRWIEAHPSIRVVVLTGEGKFFCTGMELGEEDANSPRMSFAIGSDFHTLNALLIRSEKVLIAAVNGPAAGYGATSLALFDLVYAVPEAYFFTPFTKLAMGPEAASSFAFPALMGHQKASAMMLAGERISAEDADRLGLVTKLLPKEGFFEEVMVVAKRMADAPPGGVRSTKALMRNRSRQELLDANDRECAVLQGERFGSEENLRAVEAFRVEQEERKKRKGKL